MEPTVEAFRKGHLDSLRPVEAQGIVYVRGRCDSALPNLLGVDKLPVLARNTKLAWLIMVEAHEENHRLSPSDVLARSRQRAWIIRGKFLAKEVCKYYPKCILHKTKLSKQLFCL